MRYGAAVKLADIEWENMQGSREREMHLAQFMSLDQGTLLVGLKEIGMEHVRLELQAAIGMGFHYRQDERGHHIYCSVFVGNILFVRYVYGQSYVKNVGHALKQQSCSSSGSVAPQTELPCMDVTGGRNAKETGIYSTQIQLRYRCGIRCSIGDDGVEGMHAGSWYEKNTK